MNKISEHPQLILFILNEPKKFIVSTFQAYHLLIFYHVFNILQLQGANLQKFLRLKIAGTYLPSS